MPNRNQENTYYRSQYPQQWQNVNNLSQQYSSYTMLPNSNYYNSQETAYSYQEYNMCNAKNQYSTASSCIYEQDCWMPDSRFVTDLEKGLDVTDKMESIEITSKDLSPASGCSNLDLFSDFPVYKNFNTTSTIKNYSDYPSCSQLQINVDNSLQMTTDKSTTKYCSMPKLSISSCDYSQYMPSTDCFQDVFSGNEICQDFSFIGTEDAYVNQSVQLPGEDSDIIVEESEDEDFLTGNETEEPKMKCLVCQSMFSSVNGQFFTTESPLNLDKDNTTFGKLKMSTNDYKDNYFLCTGCFTLINSIEQLENKLKICALELDGKLGKPAENLSKSTNTKCNHKIICKICDKSLPLRFFYRRHLQQHKLINNRLLCDICGRRFSKLKQFKLHMRIHNVPIKRRSQTCRICLKKFKTNSNLREHENYCSGKMPFKCARCSKKFSTSTKLKNHVKLKHEKKFNAICSICNIGFVQMSEYKRHMISHSTDKKYACTKCDKAYKTLGNLNFHMKFHDTELPFLCTICSKGFMRKEYLDAHTAKHTGERNFACTLCEKKFAAQKNLDAHLKYHDGDSNKKSCHTCGKLVNKFVWEDHLRTHSNLREFECDKCDMRFNTKSAHQKHKKRKHDNEFDNGDKIV